METASTTPFVPVAPYQGRKGFDTASSGRLRELLDRYRSLKADPTASPELRTYARVVCREIRDEFARRQGDRRAA